MSLAGIWTCRELAMSPQKSNASHMQTNCRCRQQLAAEPSLAAQAGEVPDPALLQWCRG